MKYSNETSLIGKAANSLDIKGAIIGKTLDFIIQFINNKVNEKKWKNLFLETGEQVVKNLDDQDGFKNDLLVIFSKDNMQNIAEKSYDKRGYELISYLENEIVELFIEYGVSERNAHEYSYHFIQIILDELKQYDTDKALESYLEIWRKQSVQNYFSLKKQLDAIEIEVKKLGKDNIHVLSIEDIEEKIEGYEEIKPGYDLVDTNEFTKQQLLEDNLVTSKAMLIEKSQNKEELYQNIEDIISCKNKMEDFEYEQLEKIVKYELMGTEDKEIISKFIEKIKNREESENIMMNAARIINKEIRKQRREGREEGREEGMIFVAKKLKGKMHIKDISQITGLSEKEIEKL